ncbi:MAG: rhodanese-like domain-containing protein [Patescibacteria group bacterium]
MDIKEIDSNALKTKLDKGEKLLLIDLLGEKSYESLHLPQAISVDPSDGFVPRVTESVGGDLSQLVVVYGASFKDELSTRKVEELLLAGFTNVRDFKGGLKDWAAELLPFEGKRAPSAK